MTIEIDRQVLMQALSSSQHNRILLCRDYKLGSDSFRESLDVDGCGVTGGKVKLTISREKIEKSPLGPNDPVAVPA